MAKITDLPPEIIHILIHHVASLRMRIKPRERSRPHLNLFYLFQASDYFLNVAMEMSSEERSKKICQAIVSAQWWKDEVSDGLRVEGTRYTSHPCKTCAGSLPVFELWN